ncbi:MAG: DNA-3-methyladenine glycosylase 2 family protein [Proteobacteria bacterium]|nr:DNA-3-methyladenine glycosylase 2 family protein [Pseudomonadota bacterium]NBX85965.1 DNA-3-methyladenine glycosylase 2 family protein [Pseudomonadota bacterium]
MLGKPAWWDEGCAELAARDAALAEIMRRHDGHLVGRGEALTTLLRSIVGQQISVKAADAVWGKFIRLVDGDVDAARVLKFGDGDLRGCGLSGQKVKYLRGVCAGFVDGTVHPGLWQGMADEAIIAELVKLPGIGRWTAEMFLIFHLLRPDVLPLGDLGLLKGYEQVYGSVRGTAKLEGMARWKKVAVAVDKKAAVWQPYRSIATWYLWRSLDPVVVEY